VIPVSVARTVRALMRDVVDYGTGTAAQIPGVVVAGKTAPPGHHAAVQCRRHRPSGASGSAGATGATGATACQTSTQPLRHDAWFVAFAPEIRPRVVVAVLLPNDGAGGTSAAPLAKPISRARWARVELAHSRWRRVDWRHPVGATDCSAPLLALGAGAPDRELLEREDLP